jgi:hypothetical protein
MEALASVPLREIPPVAQDRGIFYLINEAAPGFVRGLWFAGLWLMAKSHPERPRVDIAAPTYLKSVSVSQEFQVSNKLFSFFVSHSLYSFFAAGPGYPAGTLTGD